MPGFWVDKFIEICAIIAADRQFCSKRGNLTWSESVGALRKTSFNCAGWVCCIISVNRNCNEIKDKAIK